MKQFNIVLCAVFIILVVYGGLLTAPFLWDDEWFIVANNFVGNIKNVVYLFDRNYFTLFGELSYRPVVTLSHMLGVMFFLKNPVNHRLMSLFFHCLNIYLVYRITNRNLSPDKRKYIVFLVPILFGLFPLHTETLAVVAYRADILMTFFLLLALQRYLSGSRRYFITMGLLTLSLFSKETALIFFPVVMVLDYIRGVNRDSKLLIRYTAIVLVYGLYIYVRFFLMSNPLMKIDSYFVSDIQMILRPFITVFAGLGLILIPFWGKLDYNAYEVLMPVILFGVVFFIFMLPFYKRIIADSILRTTSFLTVLSLVTVMNFYPLENIFASRYLYLPSIGVALFLVRFIVMVFQKNRTRILVLLWLVLFMSCSALAVQGHFLTRIAFAEKMVSDSTNNYKGYNYLGTIKHEQGDIGLAKSYYQQALLINPYYYESCYNLASVFLSENKLSEAITLCNRLMSLNAGRSDGYRLMGNIMLRQGGEGKAMSFYRKALKINKYDLESRNNIGTIYESKNRLDKAAQQYMMVLKIDPKYDLAWSNLGNIGIKRKDYPSAEECYLKALSIVSDNDKTWYNLGNAYFRQKKLMKSERAYKQSLILNPLSSGTLYNLSVLYASRGEKEKAVQMLSLYVKLEPSDKKALQYLKMIME